MYFKHEGENPTGSFKDRGMSVAVWRARQLGCSSVVCASTGNTSSSMAAYAAWYGLSADVFLSAGKVSEAKIRQTMAYGARLHEVDGNFDDALVAARAYAQNNSAYLVNSTNPYRIAGQMTMAWELLADLDFVTPDWVVVPGGNLGNTVAIGRALVEAYERGWVKRIPRLLTVQAVGASPFERAYKNGFREPMPQEPNPKTVASAIQIGAPVNYGRAREVIKTLLGIVTSVSDECIIAAKKRIDLSGLGCEPASAATLAGVKQLMERGIIKKDARIVCILTGSILKS